MMCLTDTTHLSLVLQSDDADEIFELTTTIRSTRRIRKPEELPIICNAPV